MLRSRRPRHRRRGAAGHRDPSDSFTAATVAFKLIGTAVRATGCPPLPRPFTTELSGPDFAKLLMDGWVPAGIALGISAAGLHDNLVTTSSGPWGTGNAEVPTYTDLMAYARQDARSRLEHGYARWVLTASSCPQ